MSIPTEILRVSSPAPAPIILFAFKRPEHLRRTLDSLAANPEAAATSLTVYCDGARHAQDEPGVGEVRRLVADERRFGSVRAVHQPVNRGLARSIIDGTTEALRLHDRVIVMEDDLVVSPHFLRYMNDGLARYADDARVASIHGYSYPVDEVLPETFFLQGADCWGWATWARAWARFDEDGERLLSRLRERRLMHGFDLDGRFPYGGMLMDQIAGRNNSWAIRWRASAYLAGMYTLYPGRSLVDNIGNDSSGTHCETTDAYGTAVARNPIVVGPIPVEECRQAVEAFGRFLGRQVGWRTRARQLLQRAASLVG